MNLDNPEAKAFLFELYTMTQGDPEAHVSMYDVGTTLGLEKDEAGTMAEDLYTQGFAELKTLSGGIGITSQGLKALDIPVAPEFDDALQLGAGPVLEDVGKEAVNTILQDIKTGIARGKQVYPQLEEMVIDIKTIETQMLSPNPKTQVIREVLRSLHTNIAASGPEDLAVKLDIIITS
jgi:hypothetical protein